MNHDFTHCVTEECPLRDTCKRSLYYRLSSFRGWISVADFYDKDKNECEFYINHKII